jgi:hypothetical protein
VVVTLGEGRQYGGPTEAARLKGAIDSGHTRDKVPGFDPAQEPLAPAIGTTPPGLHREFLAINRMK